LKSGRKINKVGRIIMIIFGFPPLLVSVGVLGLLTGMGRGKGFLPPLHLRCPKCNSRIPERIRRIARFCPYCGAELVVEGYCPECKISYGPGIRYCPIHGIELFKEKEEEKPKAKEEEAKAPEAEIGLSDGILKVVKDHPGITLSGIADSLGMPYQRLTLSVKKLVEEGKIRKRNMKYFPK